MRPIDRPTRQGILSDARKASRGGLVLILLIMVVCTVSLALLIGMAGTGLGEDEVDTAISYFLCGQCFLSLGGLFLLFAVLIRLTELVDLHRNRQAPPHGRDPHQDRRR